MTTAHQFFTITGQDFRESIARSRRQSNSVRDQIQDRINRSGLRLQEQTGLVDSCMSIQRLHAAALEAELRGFDGLAGALRRLMHDWAARAYCRPGG